MHQLADAAHELGLAALQVADEVPAERVAVCGVLRLEVLRPVLAHDLDPRLGQDGHVLDRDILRRGDDRDFRADLVAYPREPLGICSADKPNDTLRAAGPARAALGEEEVRAAARADIDALDLGRACIRAASSAAVQRSSLPALTMPEPNLSRNRPATSSPTS